MFSGASIPEQDKSFEEYKSEIIGLGKEKKFDEALVLLEESKAKFLKEKHFQSIIYRDTAFGFYQLHQFGKALSLLERTSKEYPSNPAISALYARVLIKIGKINEALPILKRYPSNVDSFTKDIDKSNLNIWTTYNLAACYALLNQPDLALVYLSTIFATKGFDLRASFLGVEKDSDFDSVRNDQRYLTMKDLALAEDFDSALKKIEHELKQAQKAFEQLSKHKIFGPESLDNLFRHKKNIFEIYTVAPNLIDIQRKAIDYIGNLEGVISGKKQLSLEKLQESYDVITHSIERAKASQTTSK